MQLEVISLQFFESAPVSFPQIATGANARAGDSLGHLIVVLAKCLRPSRVRAVVAESLLLKQRLILLTPGADLLARTSGRYRYGRERRRGDLSSSPSAAASSTSRCRYVSLRDTLYPRDPEHSSQRPRTIFSNRIGADSASARRAVAAAARSIGCGEEHCGHEPAGLAIPRSQGRARRSLDRMGG